MTHGFAFAAVAAATAAWTLLPFVPALRELLRPTDAAPLTMVGRDSGDITHFADGFRAFLDRHPELLEPTRAAGDVGTLGDGSGFARVASADGWERLPRGARGEITALVVVDAPLALPDGEVFAAEVYARQPLRGGVGATYRALLADAECVLPEDSVATRWVHARGPLDVGGDSALHNRASSDTRITMAPGVRFDRLGAPLIEVAADGLAPERERAPAAAAEGAPDAYHWIDGDLALPAGAVLRGHVVVRGAATLGRDARIIGSLKAHGRVSLDVGAVVTAALVTRLDVRLGESSCVGGPVIAEGDVELLPWARVGCFGAPTTVTCRRLTMRPGARICGRVATREGGRALGRPDAAA